MRSLSPCAERFAWLYKELAPRMACDILVYSPTDWVATQERQPVHDALRKGEVAYEEKRP